MIKFMEMLICEVALAQFMDESSGFFAFRIWMQIYIRKRSFIFVNKGVKSWKSLKFYLNLNRYNTD